MSDEGKIILLVLVETKIFVLYNITPFLFAMDHFINACFFSFRFNTRRNIYLYSTLEL